MFDDGDEDDDDGRGAGPDVESRWNEVEEEVGVLLVPDDWRWKPLNLVPLYDTMSLTR